VEPSLELDCPEQAPARRLSLLLHISPCCLLPRPTPGPPAWPGRPHRNSASLPSVLWHLHRSLYLTHPHIHKTRQSLQPQPQTDLILVRCDENWHIGGVLLRCPPRLHAASHILFSLLHIPPTPPGPVSPGGVRCLGPLLGLWLQHYDTLRVDSDPRMLITNTRGGNTHSIASTLSACPTTAPDCPATRRHLLPGRITTLPPPISESPSRPAQSQTPQAWRYPNHHGSWLRNHPQNPHLLLAGPPCHPDRWRPRGRPARSHRD